MYDIDNLFFNFNFYSRMLGFYIMLLFDYVFGVRCGNLMVIELDFRFNNLYLSFDRGLLFCVLKYNVYFCSVYFY